MEAKWYLCNSAITLQNYINMKPEYIRKPYIRNFATNDPIAFLNQDANGLILDDVQNVPHLLSYIQGIVDEDSSIPRLCAGRADNLFVASEFSYEIGVSVNTIKSWLSVLQASYVIR